MKALHAKLGELTLENDLLSGALGKAGLLSAKRRSTATTAEFAKRLARGNQLTSARSTGLLLGNAVAVSMDGRGAWRGNVFPTRHLAGDVERLWRSVKYGKAHLRACGSVGAARRAP